MNLLAALIINPIFRARPALFGMHIGLMLLVIALAIGQLTRYRGHFEISEGQAFDPETVIVDRTGYIKPVLPQEGTFRQGESACELRPWCGAKRDGQPCCSD
ncbi:MAG: cytochrome c biogenesis protein ResB [Candidatus Thiodiazotropha sp. (ex Lucinoma borealis)]|nr:cytochrome c biogenesis protein ResB [Candidatus Thiodiazotropha sp. (ex Lucinoma borealis)]